ncbi:unnamed protein product [Rotaria magnacalcarata]|uniref:Uncharacterized protein n=1 Tax=Rotaria magnacalcarata TaxID=392030 RepID=A0A816DUR1_9BILA|nr:unnamed protein product [Rotaria magnacalcarata]CAF1638476.1 unnamed protein product [Rotaria magnacalcarata]CAF2068297.1 unnamed protein product [Rotaria magnacalcarata]CAF2185039.1 unnamed protein product [Rotaria magnacalcarata]CAF4006383.1 unnamed protein product [Rotaria magnacalcarata]
MRLRWVDLTERYIFVCIICVVYFCQYSQSQSTDNSNAARNKKKLEELEELEEINEDKREKELGTIYSSSKANQFLTYDKCMQRMKCPVNRKEECSEECKTGNTEEEIEEHIELTKGESRNSFSKTPKQKYEPNVVPKKSPSKTKHSSTGKTDL